MDRGLEISTAAAQLNVTPDTLINWEQGRNEPSYSRGKNIFTFLGYCPFEEPNNLGDRLRLWRWQKGFSYRKAASEISIDPTTWQSWESATKHPSTNSVKLLNQHGVLPPSQSTAQLPEVGT